MKFYQDAITESMSIGIGKAAAVLSSLVDREIEFAIPEVSFVNFNNLRTFLSENYNQWNCCVFMQFDGGFEGDSLLIFDKNSAKHWIQIIGTAQFGTPDVIMPEMETDLLLEVGNIIVNGCIGSIANLLQTENHYYLPQFFTRYGSEIYDDMLEADKRESVGIVIETKFTLENEDVETELIVTLKEKSTLEMMDGLMNLV